MAAAGEELLDDLPAEEVVLGALLCREDIIDIYVEFAGRRESCSVRDM